MGVLNGTKEIVKGGYRVEPILYSQSGSSYSGSVYWTGSLFESTILNQTGVGDFAGSVVVYSAQYISPGDTEVVGFDHVNNSCSFYDTSTFKYTVPQLAVDNGIELSFVGYVSVVGLEPPVGTQQDFQVDLFIL